MNDHLLQSIISFHYCFLTKPSLPFPQTYRPPAPYPRRLALRLCQVHAVQTNEIFLLVGEVMAQIAAAFAGGSDDKDDDGRLAAARSPFADFVQEPWWDVAVSRDEGGQKAASLPDTLRALCEESSALLRRAFELALGPLPAPLELALTAERFGRVVGMFEQNNVGVRAPSPIPNVLRELLSEAEGGDGDEATDDRQVLLEAAGLVDEMMDAGCPRVDDGEEEEMDPDEALELLRSAVGDCGCPEEEEGEEEEGDLYEEEEDLFAPLDGTALYSLICCMNHSCRPNCVVRYPGRTRRQSGKKEPGDGVVLDASSGAAADPLVAEVVLLEDVSDGDELTQSYVTREMGLAERRKALEDYGFFCTCPRCVEEESEGASS